MDNPATVNDPDDLVTLRTGGTNGTDAIFVTATRPTTMVMLRPRRRAPW